MASTSTTTAREAEAFLEEIDREYYLHLAGHKPELEIEPIYERHAGLFERATRSSALRELAVAATATRRRAACATCSSSRSTGCSGARPRPRPRSSARLEASLEIEVDGEPVPYRQARSSRRTSPTPTPRGARGGAQTRCSPSGSTRSIEGGARAHRTSLSRARLGRLRATPTRSFARSTSRRSRARRASFARRDRGGLRRTRSTPSSTRVGLPPLGELRRSDLPRFFRAADLDALFPAERLVPSFAATLAGLGIDLTRSPTSTSTPSRGRRSRRAPSARPPRVPDEVYLVIAPVGGRDDYRRALPRGRPRRALRARRRGLAFEFRHLGDNSVTESFAFLFEHLTEDPAWLAEQLGIDDARAVADHARAARLVLLRRYCGEARLRARAARAERPDLRANARALRRAARRRDRGPRGRARPGSRTSTRASTSPATCAPGRSRPTGAAALRERFGERWFAEPRGGRLAARAVAPGPAARRPRSCSRRRSARASTSAR